MIKQLLPAFFLLIVCAGSVAAQRSVEEAAKSARDQISDVKNRSIELERMKNAAAKRPSNDNAAPKFPEIKEDFEKIQRVNAKILELTAEKAPVNYAAVLKLVTEINQRAVRLKSNLFSAESGRKKDEKNKRQTAESLGIQTLVKILDKSVTNFVRNSLFQNVRVVNSNDSLDAENDLETVIKTSRSIAGKAKKLKQENSER